jgi:hypothetical protein
MRNIYKLFILTTFLLITFATNTLASGFYLKSIGTLDVSSTSYDHYWYTSINPNLSGLSPANATVTITIDSQAFSAQADANGNWNYQTSIGEGDHSIKLSTPASSDYNFTLTIGPTPEGVGSLQSSDTPVAGVSSPTFILLLSGISFLSLPYLLRRLTKS